MTLDPDEIQRITKRKRWSAQIRVLNQMGIPHKVRPDGSPWVTEADIRTDGKVTEPEPDWDMLNA